LFSLPPFIPCFLAPAICATIRRNGYFPGGGNTSQAQMASTLTGRRIARYLGLELLTHFQLEDEGGR
jgi:hypothetical protein